MGDKLIKLTRVLELIQMPRSSWYRQISENNAPKPVKINRASFWSLQAVQEFIEDTKKGEFK